MSNSVIIGDATLYLTLEQARGLTRSQRHRLRQRGVDVPKVPQKSGFTQMPEHVEKRKRLGPDAWQWKGDAVTAKGGRSRAIRAYPAIGPCVQCGAAKSERHHKDENPANNEPSNIEVLCRKCHMAAHKELRCLRK